MVQIVGLDFCAMFHCEFSAGIVHQDVESTRLEIFWADTKSSRNSHEKPFSDNFEASIFFVDRNALDDKSLVEKSSKVNISKCAFRIRATALMLCIVFHYVQHVYIHCKISPPEVQLNKLLVGGSLNELDLHFFFEFHVPVIFNSMVPELLLELVDSLLHQLI
jgi:hypothetical protein